MKMRVSLVLCLVLVGVRAGAQNCSFSTDQQGKIVETCGNVGIGTTAPAAGVDLHVKNAASAEIRVEGGAASADTGLRIIGDRTWKLGSNISSSGAGKFTIFDVTGASSRLVIDPAVGVGVGPGFTTPWGGLHLLGAGQASVTPSLASGTPALHGATLFLQDTGGGVNNGGMLAFGAGDGNFAGIKGLLTDGSGNKLGHLSFFTRNASADTNLTERMRIWRDGRITVGSATPLGRFTVWELSDSAVAFNGRALTTVELNTTQYDYGVAASASQTINAGVTNGGGVVGLQVIGENAGPGSMQQAIGSFIQTGMAGAATGSITNAFGDFITIVAGQGTVVNGYGIYIGDIPAGNAYGIYQDGVTDKNYFKGSVGIGTAAPTTKLDVVGDIHASGSITADVAIYAKYQDVAEWVESVGETTPGTVVIIAAGLRNVVAPSQEAYDLRVAGVVSARPGVVLGERGDSKVTVATTGRVKVKCDATRAPIHTGDILVTSSNRGMAMRSEPVDVAGIKMHRPGTVIGKALEPLDSGTGEILVLLTLQ